ncbi:MAG: hypothetical protein ABIU84_10180 [Thermoanaerobaculia bacterium]
MESSKPEVAAALVRPSPREAGFSVIEGLIAALLLLVVTLGILPLFSRAMSNNVKGNDSTRQSNGAIDSFESNSGLYFNSGGMRVLPGTSETVVLETLALNKIASPTGGVDVTMSNRWEPAAAVVTPDVPVMNRQMTLRQYAFDDFADNQELEDPLNGDSEDRLVHLKLVDVELSDATGASPVTYRLRTVRAY